MISVDKYFDRQYHPKNYNCAHFAAEVWRDLTGRDISHHLGCFLNMQAPEMDLRNVFIKVPEPKGLALALMKNGYENHAGVFMDNKILHITEFFGVQFLPVFLIERQLQKIGFYETANNY